MEETRSLSKREMEIFHNVLEGKTSKEISKDLGISPRTTDTHRKNIASKLGTSNAVDWVRLAIKRGIIKL